MAESIDLGASSTGAASGTAKAVGMTTGKKLCIALVGLVVVGAGVGAAVVLLASSSDPDTVPVSVRVLVTGGGGSSTRRLRLRRLLDGDIQAGGNTVSGGIQKLGYAISSIQLCNNVNFVQEGIYKRADLRGANCVNIFSGPDRLAIREITAAQQCAAIEAMEAQYTDMSKQSEVDRLFGNLTQVVPGTYTHAHVTYQTKILFQGTVDVSDGTNNFTLYTKACGPTTCGSICNGADNMRDCLCTTSSFVGQDLNNYECRNGVDYSSVMGSPTPNTLPNEPPLGGEGTTFSFGGITDTWTNTSWGLVGGQTFGTGPGGYWRRCAQRMDTGPSEAIFVDSKDGGDSVLSRFVEPVVISATEPINVRLAYSLEGIVRGNVKPMNDNGGNRVSHTGFYDVSDGFYQMTLAALPLTPITYTDDEQVWKFRYRVQIRRSDLPWCPPAGVASDQCHPCKLLTTPCIDEDFTGNLNDYVDANWDSKRPDVDYDLLVDLFYAAPLNASAAEVDGSKPRAASVNKVFAEGFDAGRDLLSFQNMRVEKITHNNATSTLDLEDGIQWTLLEEIARVKDLPILTAVGQSGIAKVILSTNAQPNNGSPQLYFQCNTTLEEQTLVSDITG